jgi:DNA invertase Pin-like site-specific DNA recombinase
MRVVGYVRVSTAEQADSGLGLEAQREAIRAEIERRGWTLTAIHEDAAASAKSMNRRPGLEAALRAVNGDDADALVVAKLDRLSRSLLDFAGVMSESQRRGWALVILDVQVDTSTPSGELIANVMATFAQFERKLIGQRTSAALAVKRSQGVRLGRPRTLPPKVVRRIKTMRNRGNSLAAIANALNDDGTPTAHGGRCWYPATIRKVLTTQS